MSFYFHEADVSAGNRMLNLMLGEGKVPGTTDHINYGNQALRQQDVIVISDDEDVEEVRIAAKPVRKRSLPSTNHTFPQARILDFAENYEVDYNTYQHRNSFDEAPKRQKVNHGCAGFTNGHLDGPTEANVWTQQMDYTTNFAPFPKPAGDSVQLESPFPSAVLPTEPNRAIAGESTSSNKSERFMTPPPRRPKKRKREAPYFDDPCYGIRMYRGPGYERFAIALGNDPTHNEICNRWDVRNAARQERRNQRQTRYNDFGAYVDSAASLDSNDVTEDEEDSKVDLSDRRILAQILEVLPDIDASFVLEKVKSRRESFIFGVDQVHVEPDVHDLLAEILDLEKYPRRKSVSEEEVDPLEVETGKKIKFKRSQEHRDRDYIKDAVMVLATEFGHVPTHYINKVLNQTKSAFDAYISVEHADTNYFQREVKPYVRPRQPRILLEKKYQRPNPSFRNQEEYRELVNEVQAAKQHIAREALRLNREREKIDFEAANLAQHKADGNIVECQCCFDEEIPINRAVACEGQSVHWFCFSCVKGLADSQVGCMKYEMLCMDGSGCKFKLSTTGVAQAVPIKVFDRLAFNQQQAEIAAAGLEGLEQCPWCDFKAICDPIETDPAFRCQNPDCFKVTCRKCHEPSHHPKTCEDFKNDRGLNARHRVEEARSEAMMRACPKCKTKIIKEFGCNKMRCTCSATMCYVCKEDISHFKDGGYEHFNRKGAKCSLYDRPNVDRHIKEADDAEKIAIQKAKELDASLDETELQIETGKKPAQKPAITTNKPRRHRPPIVNFPRFHNQQLGFDLPLNDPQNDHNAMGNEWGFYGLDGAQDGDLNRRERLEEDLHLLQEQVMIQRERLNDPLRNIADYGQELAQAQRIRAHHEELARRRRQSVSRDPHPFTPLQHFRTHQQQAPNPPIQPVLLPPPPPAALHPLPPQLPRLQPPVPPQLPVLPPLDFMRPTQANNFGVQFNDNNNNNAGLDFLNWQYGYNPWNNQPTNNDENLQFFTGLLPTVRPFPAEQNPQQQQQIDEQRL